MFIFLSIMTLGVITGYLLRHKNHIHMVSYAIPVVVCTLLFLLGISVGVNETIVDNLSYYCEQAAIISFLGILGSLIAALLLYHFFFKHDHNHEK